MVDEARALGKKQMMWSRPNKEAGPVCKLRKGFLFIAAEACRATALVTKT
eukprot:CAMPEP_0185907100 /NCGR_PEP_ID=MMETSP0196C-20130402/6407_1 /TAXON_ID=2932 /ORGANISM="Alexandrium fundyense, Strain CCMP1719" /LENGTH=49 /DNA_ID= /DNA_START= /DNA_END= /DNA_ORIENTATION=